MTVRENIDIGACRTLWTPDGGSEIDLGLTEDGVEISISEKDFGIRPHELTADIMKVVDESEVSGDIVLVEHTLDNIAVGLRSVKTTVAGTPVKEAVNMSPLRGRVVPFGKLVFHPRRLVSTDKSKDVTIWMAMLAVKGKRIFKANKNGTVSFSFTAGLKQDDSTSKWFPLYTEGDPAAVEMFDL